MIETCGQAPYIDDPPTPLEAMEGPGAPDRTKRGLTHKMDTNTRHCMHWKGVVTMVRERYMAVTPYCRCCNSFFTRYRSLCHPVTAVYDGVKDMTAKTNLQTAAAFFAGIPEARVATQQPSAV